MEIANNILKRSLQNVYFFVGTACGGKTTLGRALAEKYGFTYFSDNWNEPNWKEWESIIDPRYQPYSSGERVSVDWEAYFSRSVEEFLLDKTRNQKATLESVAFSLVEIIKLAQGNTVVADIWIEDFAFLLEISDYSRIACMLAPGELIIRDYYQRDDHIDFTRCIQSLKDPEKKFATQNELFRLGAIETAENAKKYNFFTHMRDEKSTVPATLAQLERHFGLGG